MIASGYTIFCLHQAIKKLYKNENFIWDKKPLKCMTEKVYATSKAKPPYDLLRYKLKTYHNAEAYILATMAHGFDDAVYNIKDDFILLTNEFLTYNEGIHYYFRNQVKLINSTEFKNGESELFNLFINNEINIYTLSILNKYSPFLNNWLLEDKILKQPKFIMSIKQNYQTLNYDEETIKTILQETNRL